MKQCLVVSIIAAITVALAGCSSPDRKTTSTSVTRRPVKICIYTHGDDGTFWSMVQRGAEDAAKELGVAIDYRGSRDRPDVQLQLIDAGINGGCSAIGVSAPDPDAIRAAMTAAKRDGIPTLTINSGVESYRQLGAFTHIGQDELLAGNAAGRKFNGLGAKTVLCVIHEAANLGLRQRCKGAAQTFDGKLIDFNADDALSNLVGAQAKITAALEANPAIDAVFALNADVATGAVLPAVKAAHRKMIVGTFDLSPEVLAEISNGDLAFAIDQQEYAEGYLAVQLLNLAVKDDIRVGGGQPIYTGPEFVTKGNVKAVEAAVRAGVR